jgi:hypothetical protein
MWNLHWITDLFGKKENEHPKDEYPKTVAEVLDDTIKYRPETHEAMIKFKKSNPWIGTRREMQRKFKTLNADLAKVYKIERPQVIFVRRFVYGACYFPIGNLIIMEREKDGRYSVVTFLHEFGHALGKNEKETCRWSINLFKHHFPKSFARLVPEGHLLKLPKEDDKKDFLDLPVG